MMQIRSQLYYMKRTNIIFFLLVLFIGKVLPSKAQEITGLWEGILHNDSTGQNQIYDIAITEKNGKLFGYSRTGFIINDQVYFGVKRFSVKKVDGKIILHDDDLIANNYPVKPPKGIAQLSILQLYKDGKEVFLSGPFTTNATKKYSPVTGSLKLYKKPSPEHSFLLPHLQALGLEKELSFLPPGYIIKDSPIIKSPAVEKTPGMLLALRKTLVQENVFFTSDSIHLSLYDNGEIDGDTVTVFLNDAVIVSQQRLSEKAIKYTIPAVNMPDSFRLVMYAENLGTIPPNTGLIVVQSGKERYEIRFTGDYSQNAAIIFRRKKEN